MSVYVLEGNHIDKDTRDQIISRIGIENRPKEVEDKQRFGDLEIDLVIGKTTKEHC